MPWPLLCFDSVDSTNSWVKRHIDGLQRGLTFVVSCSQTAGRGRCERTWVSPKGNLYVTAAEPARMPLVTYGKATALALQAILTSRGVQCRIKWPNDILVGEEKIAGILVEEASCRGTSWAIVGVGLNVNMDKTSLTTINRPATSMQSCLHQEVDLHDLQQALLQELARAFQEASDRPEKCHASWVNSCMWMVGGVAAPHADGTVEGFLDDGGMRVRGAKGNVFTVYSTQ